VSFLKAQSYQDAHPGNSNPLDEQAFVVNVVNTLEQSPFWNSTAIIIAYDDSDGCTTTCRARSSMAHSLLRIRSPEPTPAERRAPRRCFPVRTLGASRKRPLQPRRPDAAVSHLSVGKGQLHRSHLHDPDFHHPVYRGQLESGRIGGGSYDAIANPINNMFNFVPATPPNTNAPILSPVTGLLRDNLLNLGYYITRRKFLIAAV